MYLDKVRLSQAFGAALRTARVAAGLSQEQLALDAEIDRTFVSLMERGLRVPTLTTIFGLAVILKVTPSNLVEGAEQAFYSRKTIRVDPTRAARKRRG